MRRLVFPSVNDARHRVHRYLHALGPIGVHLPVLVVEALELELEIGPLHHRLVNRGLQLEHVVAHRQVVLNSERRQNYAVSYGERQSEIVLFWLGKKKETLYWVQ